MKWEDITKKTPLKNVSVLFYSKDLDAYLVGYWSEDENCMVQYPDDREGWKWSVKKWSYISDVETPTCSSTERAFLDELKEKGRWSESDDEYTGIAIGDYSFINQCEFNTPLKELVNAT